MADARSTVNVHLALGDGIAIDAEALRERYPSITLDDLTADVATTDDVLRWQLPRVRASSEPVLVTIRAGGNDLLMNAHATRPPVRIVEGVLERLTRIVDETRRLLPNATIILGEIVLHDDAAIREAQWLSRVNEGIRALAESHGIEVSS